MLVVAGEKRCHVLPCFVQMRVAPVQLTRGKLLHINSFQLINYYYDDILSHV
jgi:hypothetical protein